MANMTNNGVSISKDYVLILVVIGVFIISIAGTISTYYLIQGLKETFSTGYVAQNGEMNITIESSADLNLTWRTINFSSGKVTTGFQNATLCTNGTIARGNWTVQGRGFILENIGNVNISLAMKNYYDNVTLLAGTNPYYAFNASNNESDSCISGTYQMASWYAFNATSMDGVTLCDKMYFEDNRDEVKVDLWLQVPYNSKTGSLNDTFIFTGTSNP